VSRGSSGHFGYPIDDAVDRRTVAEIQRKIVKQGKRNAVSRHFHSKNDEETIATWRSDLNRILLAFNVRSVGLVWPLLTVHFQTELAINAHVTASDIHHNVVNTKTIVSDVHHDVCKTHAIVSNVRDDVANTNTIVSELHHGVANALAIVSDIRRTMVKSQEGNDGQNLSVSIAGTPSITEQTFTIA
jgi:hypothetical protein